MNPLILVVDDTEGTRYSVSRVLRNDGFRVIEAANGTDALRLADVEIPDLTILDIHLPDMLGFEVCRRMKAAPRTASMPVLQISASYVTSKDRINGLEGGADSYLTHPVEPAVLIATVRALLRLRDLNRQVAITSQRLELALNAAPITLFELDRDLRFKWVHVPRGRRLPAKAVGLQVHELYPTEESRRLFALERHVIETGESGHALYRNDVDGVERIYDVRLEPRRDQEGAVVGVVGVATDVTDREIAKLETERARDAAQSANSAKSQFIANISHEIRTPLGVIMGFSDLILDSGPNRDENMKSVAVIKRNAVQLSKLIDEVLDLSKIEADRMEIESIRFNLPEVVEDVTSVLSLQAREKGVDLRVVYRDGVPLAIKSDPLRLRQILLNLLGNALKFTEKGNVTLTVSADAAVYNKPVLLRFEIRDTGIGISDEQAKKLFEAFIQADPSTTRRYGGTGLGLMLSKKIAHALGGELALTSSVPGQGSTFTLTVSDEAFSGLFVDPKNPLAAVVEAASARAPIEGSLDGVSVLLVEDSPDNQVMIQRFLSQAGAEVSLASDGRAGVEKASTGKYNVVLMDIQMPVMDGYTAARELRAKGVSLPIVALTAHALKGEREKCLEAGFTDYLTKPVNRQGLITKVRELSSL